MQVPYNAWDDDADESDARDVPATAPTPEQLAEFDRHSARMLARSILVQLAVTVVVALLAWMVSGPMAGVSALVGAAACSIPNVLFALRLLFGIFRPKGTSSATFFLGEFIKLGSTGVLLGLAAKLGQDVLVWPAVFIGLVVALKSQYGLLLFKDS
ncbi:ATP synthase subunit I [Achromobacter sp. GG226]|uniref:ATP synthase subunit I n=1 Tax=Verticiella alkaliphila TaxID=2779529 RepID=UPI001C0E1554|nr:ATP synthase subunit I [Verticiella sp. GG226]MBU4611169.1 ATP synthase subunit I [Verticiella sp. GG226]